MFVKFQLVGEKILLVLLLAGMKRFAEILLAGKWIADLQLGVKKRIEAEIGTQADFLQIESSPKFFIIRDFCFFTKSLSRFCFLISDGLPVGWQLQRLQTEHQMPQSFYPVTAEGNFGHFLTVEQLAAKKQEAAADYQQRLVD